MCQEFCPGGGVSRPTPSGEVEGSGQGRGVSRPTPKGKVEGSGREGGRGTHPTGMHSRFHLN